LIRCAVIGQLCKPIHQPDVTLRSEPQRGMCGSRGMLHLGGGDYCRTVADQGYPCRCCGERHDGLPFAYGPDTPVSWHDGLTGDESSVLEQDFCIIQAEHSSFAAA
jgi:hypothetical protein